MSARLGVIALAAGMGLCLAGCSCCSEGAKESPAAAPPAAAPAESAAPAAAPAAEEIQFVKPSANYPLKKCVVSGEDLDEMGEPVAILYQGTEVQFCCPKCVKEFKQDPAKYVEMVKTATPK
jgi:YHS domain-containing protein